MFFEKYVDFGICPLLRSKAACSSITCDVGN